jgi:hypothetical protein
MTALTTIPAANAVTVQPPHRAAPVMPNDLTQCMRLSEMMAQSRLVPAHLQKSPADCLMVIMQAIRWQCDPFAVAQATSVISGKLMYEGKLVAAVINTSGRIRGRLHFDYSDEGDARQVTCSATLVGESEPVSVTVALRDAKTNNRIWLSQPDQQLAYHSARVWARRYTPELMLGVYAPDEMPADTRQEPGPSLAPPAPERDPARLTPLIELKVPGGGSVSFPKTGPGIMALLKHAAEADAGVVLLNLGLLTTIAETMPKHAAMVAEIRAKAAAELAPDWASEDEPQDDEPDTEGERRAVVAQGARPSDMTEAEASNLPE